MSTAASSTESPGSPESTAVAARRAVRDVGHLLRFRVATMRRRSAARWLVLVFVALTVAAAVVPAFTPGAGDSARATDLRVLLPTGLAAFLALAALSAVASGGGRELLARDHAVSLPVSPTTDHLGALLLAPLNIAWLLQGWLLLGSAAYALGPDGLAAAQVGILLWLAAATALAQVVAWSLEAVRRRAHGIGLVRDALALLVGAGVVLQVTGHVTAVLDRVPTVWVVVGLVDGFSWRWLLTVVALAALAVAAVVLGAVPAHLAARRAPRDELRVESEIHPARRVPRTTFGALLRTDRGSVWRSVPTRRGMAVLAIAPGLVALAGDLPWETMTVLPGLVASGGALLFGVNVWCLDGRGSLWLENLPVSPSAVFAARAVVLGEFLLVASAITLALASLRAGVPTAPEAAALLCAWLVVLTQVVGASMRWSARRPYAVDLRSARATPAPPLVMVGYSTRLAVSTTVTGLVFSGLARVPEWRVSVVVAMVCLLWSASRLASTRRDWLDPVARSRVVVAVTG